MHYLNRPWDTGFYLGFQHTTHHSHQPPVFLDLGRLMKRWTSHCRFLPAMYSLIWKGTKQNYVNTEGHKITLKNISRAFESSISSSILRALLRWRPDWFATTFRGSGESECCDVNFRTTFKRRSVTSLWLLLYWGFTAANVMRLGVKVSFDFFLIISWYTNIIVLNSGKYSMTVSVQELGHKQIVKGSKHSTSISKSVLRIGTISSYYFRYRR